MGGYVIWARRGLIMCRDLVHHEDLYLVGVEEVADIVHLVVMPVKLGLDLPPRGRHNVYLRGSHEAPRHHDHALPDHMPRPAALPIPW